MKNLTLILNCLFLYVFLTTHPLIASIDSGQGYWTIPSGESLGVGGAPNAKLTVEGVISLDETTAPSATADYGKLYVKSADSLLYYIDDNGTEFLLTGGGGGDDLGDHTADIAINMNSQNLVGANQVNGVTANFANLNATNEVNANLFLNNTFNINPSSVAATIDWSNGNRQVITMAHNISFSFSPPSLAGVGSFTLMLKQDAIGSRIATWVGPILWSSGVAPTLTTTANAVDIVGCFYDGVYYYCQMGADFR